LRHAGNHFRPSRTKRGLF